MQTQSPTLTSFRFLCYLRFPPLGGLPKVVAIMIYTPVVFITLGGVIIVMYAHTASNRVDLIGIFLYALIIGVHMVYINPVITMLCMVPFFAQAHTIRTRKPPIALSSTGLLGQATVFALVGISWFFRFKMPEGYWDRDGLEHHSVGDTLWAVLKWYQLFGWAPI